MARLTLRIKKLAHSSEPETPDDDFFLPEGGDDGSTTDVHNHLSADVREMLRKRVSLVYLSCPASHPDLSQV